jgi:hypothetical protein
MSNCRILTRVMLNLPVDVLIEDPALDFCRAKKAADAQARKISEDAMLLSWYDRSSGEFSPRVE